MVIHGPAQTLIQTYRRKQQETYKFKTVDRGQYVFCFNNEFSSFSHKVVYFYLGIGEEETLTEEMAVKATALTQIESSCVSIHEALNAVKDYQTDYRLREYRGRTLAEILNERVQWWSVGECLALLVLSLSQVLLVRSFFRGKPNRKPPRF
ncbi:transmembrane emp24 domain-containing protein 3-like [Convolutriloba macropyga]|uniref:transmembrane emp24 domain-containing protein 3-like n=1 Tax=Convolutriloba macropyga TaxID=536237 RepID=UPI003F526F3B